MRVMIMLLRINWVDDIISALISTVFALMISWFFYRLGFVDAFKNEVVSEIASTNSPEQTRKIIEKCRHLHIYRTRFMDSYKRKIDELYDASCDAIDYSYERAFVDSILDHFYNSIGIARFQITEVAGAKDSKVAYPNEPFGSILKYYPHKDNKMTEHEICRILLEYYKDYVQPPGTKEDKRIKKIYCLFDNISVSEVFNQSSAKKKCSMNSLRYSLLMWSLQRTIIDQKTIYRQDV